LKRLLIAAIVPMLLAGCATVSGRASEQTVISAKERVAPALVHIRPVKEVFARGQREERVVEGSGFIIDPEGYVVTNEHVAGESSLVRCVLYNQEEVEAEVVGTDALTDIAVLKLKADHPLPAARMGRSADLTAGQTVLALGSPHGLSRSVSMGIVSVTDRYLASGGRMASPYNTWIQTDAAINPGNSGGPLVNLRGDVVGVNARRLTGAENVGFAIPIDIAREVVEEIRSHGRVRRAWIGVTLQEMVRKTDDPGQRGVVVADVDPLSPAAEAGFAPGDVLVEVQGQPVHARFAEELPAVHRAIARLPIGEPAMFEVLRGGEQLELQASPEEKSELRGEEIELEEWGMTASDLTPAVVRRAQLPSREGVLVTGVQVGSAAQEAGLNQGDIILKMDEEPVKDLASFQRLYENRLETGQDLILLDVKRGALSLYALIEQEGKALPDAGNPDLVQ
jgi:serine protease Do